jgi:hypothetical protein
MTGRHIDVVVADRHVAHGFQLWPGGVEQFGVDAFGEQRHHHVGASHAAQQFVA